MAQGLGARGRDQALRMASSGSCSFVTSAQEPNAGRSDRVYHAPGGQLVAIDGEVFGLGGPQEANGKATAQVFLESYRREGMALLRRIRGAFSIAVWEPTTRTLSVITDPYGLRSMYYHSSEDSFAFGSRVRSVLEALPALPEVDQAGLSDFLLLGMPMGMRTLFQGIELVPPASILTVRDGSLRVTRYEELTFSHSQTSPRSLDEATDSLHAAFLAAGAEQMGTGERFHIPLSGGLDSRIVAALARRFTSEVMTYSMGDADSTDLRLAPQVAQALGLPNQAWQVSPDEWVQSVEDAVYLTDGMYNPMDAQILSVARRLDGRSGVTLDGTSSIDGHFRFFDPALQRLFPGYKSARGHLAHVSPDALIDTAGNLTLPALEGSEFVRAAHAQVRHSLEDMLWSIPEGARRTPFDAMDHMDHLHRVRRFNMMGTVLLRSSSEVRHPFFDRRVTTVIRSLRGVHRSREKIVLGQVLKRLAPVATRIPYERTGMRADAGPLEHTLRYAKLGAERVLKRVMPSAPKRAASVIDYRRFCKEEKAVQRFVRDVLGPQSRAEVLLGKRALAAVLEDCLGTSGSGRSTFFVGRLLAHELWREQTARVATTEFQAAE